MIFRAQHCWQCCAYVACSAYVAPRLSPVQPPVHLLLRLPRTTCFALVTLSILAHDDIGCCATTSKRHTSELPTLPYPPYPPPRVSKRSFIQSIIHIHTPLAELQSDRSAVRRLRGIDAEITRTPSGGVEFRDRQTHRPHRTPGRVSGQTQTDCQTDRHRLSTPTPPVEFRDRHTDTQRQLIWGRS